MTTMQDTWIAVGTTFDLAAAGHCPQLAGNGLRSDTKIQSWGARSATRTINSIRAVHGGEKWTKSGEN